MRYVMKNWERIIFLVVGKHVGVKGIIIPYPLTEIDIILYCSYLTCLSVSLTSCRIGVTEKNKEDNVTLFRCLATMYILACRVQRLNHHTPVQPCITPLAKSLYRLRSHILHRVSHFEEIEVRKGGVRYTSQQASNQATASHYSAQPSRHHTTPSVPTSAPSHCPQSANGHSYYSRCASS